MMPDRDDIIQKVKSWIEIAEEDLSLAHHAFTISSNVPYRLIGFHSQQCAEKYIKALLVYKLIDFPYTHQIEKLLSLTPIEYNLASKLNHTSKLTDYAVSRRYPDEYVNLTPEEAGESVKFAEQVKSEILNILINEGLHLRE